MTSLLQALALTAAAMAGDWLLVGTSPFDRGSLICAAVMAPVAWLVFSLRKASQ